LIFPVFSERFARNASNAEAFAPENWARSAAAKEGVTTTLKDVVSPNCGTETLVGGSGAMLVIRFVAKIRRFRTSFSAGAKTHLLSTKGIHGTGT